MFWGIPGFASLYLKGGSKFKSLLENLSDRMNELSQVFR